MGTPILIASGFAHPVPTHRTFTSGVHRPSCLRHGPFFGPIMCDFKIQKPSCGRHATFHRARLARMRDRLDRMDPDNILGRVTAPRKHPVAKPSSARSQVQIPASISISLPAGGGVVVRPPSKREERTAIERGNDGPAGTLRYARGRAATVCAHRDGARQRRRAERDAAAGAARARITRFSHLTARSPPDRE